MSKLEVKAKSKWINSLSNLMTENLLLSILIAIVLISVGIWVDHSFVDYSFSKHSSYNTVIKVVSRLFISLGEATFVFLFLQLTVESQLSEQHVDNAKNVLNDFSKEAKSTIDNFSKEVEVASKATLSAIKDQAFESFLNKFYPENFTKKLTDDAFFNFDVLRTSTTWTYKIKKNAEGKIELIEEISYTLQNLKNEEIEHQVTLETFKTNEGDPKIAKIMVMGDQVLELLDLAALQELQKPDRNGQEYNKLFKIKAKGELLIEKVVKNAYEGKKIVDFHFPTEHSLNITIRVQFLSPMEDFDFEITVPFLENAKLDYQLSGLDTRVYKQIPLALKGQSIMYEITLK
ncbi:hypothetical protein [Flavitalea sp.]|nr:hypothetical protein [Flavitalea sp.]